MADSTQAFDGAALAKQIQDSVEMVTDQLLGSMADDDYSAYVGGIKPGDTVEPKDGKLKTEEYRQRLAEECDKAERSIADMCERAERVARREMTEAPDPQALAYCQSLRSRKGATVDEVASAFERYGGNWTCYQILREYVDERQEDGDRDFYRLNPKNTLDGWQLMLKNMEREARTFLERYVRKQRYKDTETLEMRAGQVGMALRYIASNGGKSFGDDGHRVGPTWEMFERAWGGR